MWVRTQNTAGQRSSPLSERRGGETEMEEGESGGEKQRMRERETEREKTTE